MAQGGQRRTGAQMQAPSRGAQQMCAGARSLTGAYSHAHDLSGATAEKSFFNYDFFFLKQQVMLSVIFLVKKGWRFYFLAQT
jgi:hypothetical protein